MQACRKDTLLRSKLHGAYEVFLIRDCCPQEGGLSDKDVKVCPTSSAHRVGAAVQEERSWHGMLGKGGWSWGCWASSRLAACWTVRPVCRARNQSLHQRPSRFPMPPRRCRLPPHHRRPVTGLCPSTCPRP